MQDFVQTVLNWFIHDWELFGLHGQNWMLAFGGGLVLYIAMLIGARRRRSHLH